ncbi:MAG: hypothetical protein ACPLXM_12290 [Bacteroidales bacterium]
MKGMLLIILSGLVNLLWAQVPERKIHVLARAYGDSVCLRWAPDSYEGWIEGNRYGYKIVRYTLMRNDRLLSEPDATLLTPAPILPYPLSEWEKRAGEGKYEAIAAQALYGTFISPTATIREIREKAEEQEQRYSLAMLAADMSPAAARALALYFADRNVNKGEKYLYRIFFASAPEERSSDTGFVFIGPDEIFPLPKPPAPETLCEGGRITLHWNTSLLQHIFTSWLAERSVDSTGPYHSLTEEPVVSFSATDRETGTILLPDTLILDSGYLYYRIRGINAFGEVSPPSEPARAVPCELDFAIPFISSATTNDERVVLSWTYLNPEDRNHPRLTSIKIWRSALEGNNYTCIGEISSSDTSFTDNQPAETNYYKLSVRTTTGETHFSLPVLVQLTDTVPPSPPGGIVGIADTSGIVTLTWKKNPEPDIYGYRIYRGNNRKEEFSQITVAPIVGTVFYDSIRLNNLSRKVYYRLVAVDKRQNYSALSDITEVEKPDRIPPPPPILFAVSGEEKGIVLSFFCRTTDDVKEARIYRTCDEDSCLRLITILPVRADTLVWVDTAAIPGRNCTYCIQLADSAGNISTISEQIAMVRPHGRTTTLKPVIQGKKGTGKRSVELRWNNVPSEAKKVVIYRAEGEDTLCTYTSVAGNISGFTDNQVSTGKKYRYVIQPVSKDGKHLTPSDPLDIIL